MKKPISILILIILLTLTACKQQSLPNEKINETLSSEKTDVNLTTENTEEKVQIANPASVFCINNSGVLDIRTDENGSQTGYCKFDNGKECEEWAYFRKECDLDKCTQCPMISAPSPDFCKGGKIIPGEADECGCASPPKCEMSKVEAPSKFLVNFPWKKGESWSFVSGFHDENCMDFADFENENAGVVAAADGEVVLSTHSYPNSFNTYSPVETNNPEDMGNFVVIQHNKDTYSVYMHFQQETKPPVKAGDYVKAGQRIGYQGDTGWSHGRHLHFCIVDVRLFPSPDFVAKPLDSWGFKELDGSNKLTLEKKYVSMNEIS